MWYMGIEMLTDETAFLAFLSLDTCWRKTKDLQNNLNASRNAGIEGYRYFAYLLRVAGCHKYITQTRLFA